MANITIKRRTVLAGLAGAAAWPGARAATAAPDFPTEPVTLNVIDVAGQLQLVQAALEEYRRAHPRLVSHIAYSQAPAPELPGKLKAQQDAGRVDIDLVLTGTDGLSAGIDQKLWVPLVQQFRDNLPNLQDIYQPAAWN